jgi:hypothetical protein
MIAVVELDVRVTGGVPVQAVLCDICGHPILGNAYELQILRGRAVQTETGRPRIVQRAGAQLMSFMCEGCGDWTTRAMEHLRTAHDTGAATPR